MAGHSPEVLADVERLLRETRCSYGDIARATGVSKPTVHRLNQRHRWREKPPQRTVPKQRLKHGVSDPAALRVALRAHVGRQIVRFDAALRAEARGEAVAVLDSGKVLRDLGGLKRLLDELAEPAGAAIGGGGDVEHCADRFAEPAPDLAALRAEIARRYAAFAGEGTSERVPGDAAAPPSGGSRP